MPCLVWNTHLILDVFTIQVIAAISHFIIGALHLIPGLTRQDRDGWVRDWGLAKILVGLANGLSLFFDGSSTLPVERLLNLILVIGLALSIRSAATMSGRTPPRILMILFGVTGAALVALLLFDPYDVRWTVAAMGMARILCLFSLTWLVTGIARRERLMTASLMAVIFALSTIAFLLNMALNLIGFTVPAWQAQASLMAHWAVGTAIIMVTLTHFSLLLIESERTQRELREQACRDSLTGALNRFGLDQSRTALHGPVALLLIDIDHFKSLNDTKGHAAGDMVLRLLVDLAQAELGARGQVVRIGGDEFLCVLPAATPAEAEALRKALSQRFDRAVVAAVDSPHPPSLSIGIATGSADKGLDRLIRQADEAMYIVKRSRPFPRPHAQAA